MEEFDVQSDEIVNDINCPPDELCFGELVARSGMMHKPYYSIDEVAWVLDVNPDVIRNAIRSNQLTSTWTRIEGLTIADVDSWLHEY